MKRIAVLVFVVVTLSSSTWSLGAKFRPGQDPARERIIWADPFDYYSQWAYDNNHFWTGGAVPPGDPTGAYPRRSPDNSGCDIALSIQMYPSLHQMARQQWTKAMNCGPIMTPGGIIADQPSFEAAVDPGACASGGWIETRPMFARLNYTWGTGGTHSAMGMVSHSFSDRITAFVKRAYDHPSANAVNGTDAHPLVLVFYPREGNKPDDWEAMFNNMYVELSFRGDHAPTDYIWRGNPDPQCQSECCPQGPFPVICQQVRELNTADSEGPADLVYLNDHCPPLVPPYDPQTETGRTWQSIAFGYLAIMDKDPCGFEEQGSDPHAPVVDHYAVFDGNAWRQMRNGRFAGLANLPQSGNTILPWPPENNMALGSGSQSNNFSYANGSNTSANNPGKDWDRNDAMVYIKVISDYILIYVRNNFYNSQKTNPPWHAAVPRVYKGGFDTISIGVAPGCELDPATGECKEGGTPRQCITYSQSNSDGYKRVDIDSMIMFDGILVAENEPPGPEGACCLPDGSCEVLTTDDCAAGSGLHQGEGTLCENVICCPIPFADSDGDGDVDQVDFGEFQSCFTGLYERLPLGCECFDREGDGHVDTQDFNRFNACFSGADVPADPNCETAP
ncbi:MAG: hypothetical protein GXY55_06425 [Phycisphaerae bacterium]|nr:hypothetical protein [Phycisphaerae bacterium]